MRVLRYLVTTFFERGTGDVFWWVSCHYLELGLRVIASALQQHDTRKVSLVLLFSPPFKRGITRQRCVLSRNQKRSTCGLRRVPKNKIRIEKNRPLLCVCYSVCMRARPVCDFVLTFMFCLVFLCGSVRGPVRVLERRKKCWGGCEREAILANHGELRSESLCDARARTCAHFRLSVRVWSYFCYCFDFLHVFRALFSSIIVSLLNIAQCYQ